MVCHSRGLSFEVVGRHGAYRCADLPNIRHKHLSWIVRSFHRVVLFVSIAVVHGLLQAQLTELSLLNPNLMLKFQSAKIAGAIHSLLNPKPLNPKPRQSLRFP